MSAVDATLTPFAGRLQVRLDRQPTIAGLADAVAAVFTNSVKQGIAARGRAAIVLSGGRTPEIYLPRLASLDLPWQQIIFFLSDERWVDESSPHSNAAMLKRVLLSHDGPSRSRFVPLWNAAANTEAGLKLARSSLSPIDEPYDLALLGMGGDGHFASLFPGMPLLSQWLSDDNTERLVAVPPPATAPPPIARASMTAAEIKRAARIVLVLQGQEKLRVLDMAMQAGASLELPVRALASVEAIWCP